MNRVINQQSEGEDRIINEQQAIAERLVREHDLFAERLISEIQNLTLRNARLAQSSPKPIASLKHVESPMSVSHVFESSQTVQVSRHLSTVTSCYEFVTGRVYHRQTAITTSDSGDDNDNKSQSSLRKQTKNNWSFFPTFASRCLKFSFRVISARFSED